MTHYEKKKILRLAYVMEPIDARRLAHYITMSTCN